MLQERRGVTVTSSTTSSISSDISVIHQKNKTELIQDYFDDAKRFVERALKSDEKNDRMTALDLYNKALNAAQSGLSIIQSSQQVTSTMRELKKKMEKLKEQVKSRMEVLLEEESQSRTKSTRTGSHSTTKPPNKTVGSTTACSTVGTKTVEGGGGGRQTVGAEADVIFSTSVGCKVVRVDNSGRVLKCTPSESLNIFRYKKRIPGQPPAFLQCGDFVYPLIPGQSPVLHTSHKGYVFPDIDTDGGTVGVIFSSMPNDELKELNHVFSVLSDFRVSGEEPVTTSAQPGSDRKGKEESETTPTWGASISEKIDAGVSWVSGKISTGTDKAGELLNKGGDKVRDNIEPREEPLEIPEPVEKGAYYARKVSGAVVGVSDFLMTTLAKGTVFVGKKIGTAVAESDMMKDTEINPHAKEAWKVTKSTVKGAGQVFSDLEHGARSIIREAGQETSKTVGHKYGEQAGRVSDDSLTSAGHVVDLASTYWSWKTWGISFLGKVGKVIASQDKEKEIEKGERPVVPPRPVTDTVSTRDSISSTVSKSHSYTPPPVIKSNPQVKTKKEVLYA